jgi:hypothetical protein
MQDLLRLTYIHPGRQADRQTDRQTCKHTYLQVRACTRQKLNMSYNATSYNTGQPHNGGKGGFLCVFLLVCGKPPKVPLGDLSLLTFCPCISSCDLPLGDPPSAITSEHMSEYQSKHKSESISAYMSIWQNWGFSKTLSQDLLVEGFFGGHLKAMSGQCWAKVHVGPSWAMWGMSGFQTARKGTYVGLCWGHLRLCWANDGPFGYVGSQVRVLAG